jgi:hypothetical protein
MADRERLKAWWNGFVWGAVITAVGLLLLQLLF